jgi:hypothetical protein
MDSMFPIALVVFGITASMTKLVKADVFSKFPDFLFSVSYPCIIILSIGKTDFNEMITENAYAVVFAAILTAVTLLIGLCLAKWISDEKKKPVAAFTMMLNNSTYVGLPVAQFLFGARGVAFIVVCGVVQDLFVWTVGYRMFSKQKDSRQLNTFLNPVMISVVIALLLSLSGAPDLHIFDDILSVFAAMTVPLALMYLGHVLASDRAAIFRIKGRVLALSALRVIAFPAIAAVFVLPLPIDSFHKSMSILFAGLPAPLLTIMLSKQFDKDSELAVELLLCSTVMYMLVFAVLQFFQVYSIR